MKKIILLSIVSFGLCACNLDLQPENGLTYSNSFNTEKEVNATTTSIQYFINTVVGSNYVFATAGIKLDTLPFAVICCCAETVRQNKTDNNNSSIRLLCWGRPVNHVNPFFSIIRV